MRLRRPLIVRVFMLIGAVVVTTGAYRQRDPYRDRDTASANRARTSFGTEVAAMALQSSGSDDHGETVTTTLFRNIARRQNPMVVAVTTQSHVKTQDMTQLFGNDDFFRQFFGTQQPHDELRRALGSGFIISPDGEIVTNSHVVDGAEQIRVALFTDEHKSYEANVVGRDPLTDTALIRLQNGPHNLPVAQLGDSDALEPGDWVMAIGNPFELGHTVTVGVISYKARPFATSKGRSQSMLQTDASINPGNSGGPLLDVRGQVVGVNAAILTGSQDSGNVGIGFAVPINSVKSLLPQLRKGSIEHGQLGAQILTTPLTDATSRQLGLPAPAGAIVGRVEPGSPAQRASLRAGDVIVRYNNTSIVDGNQLTSLIAATPPGTQVPIVFYRRGQEERATVTIEKLDLDATNRRGGQARSTSAFGLSLGTLTPDSARRVGLTAGTTGVIVEGVEPLTSSASAGVKQGDVILEINRQPVRSVDKAVRALQALHAGEVAFLLLSRSGVEQFVELHTE